MKEEAGSIVKEVDRVSITESVFLRALHHKIQAFLFCWSVKKSLEYPVFLSKGIYGETVMKEEVIKNMHH